MTRRPDDSFDDGPTIPARFRIHPEPRPTEGDVFRAVLLILLGVVILIGALVAWVVS